MLPFELILRPITRTGLKELAEVYQHGDELQPPRRGA
jgi:hypothetical protein